jgi:hypothetical protein
MPDDDSFGIETCTNAECYLLNRVVSDWWFVLSYIYAKKVATLLGTQDIRTDFLYTKLFIA